MLAPVVPDLPEFEPGEQARENGVYRVIHAEHRDAHTATILKGDTFPVCKKCGDKVRYQLWIASDYLARSWERNVKGMGLVGSRASMEKREAETGPRLHSVHIYSGDTELITRLCGIVSSGLSRGEAVLIVATAEHRMQLVSELQTAGVDVRALARSGRFMMVDAHEALSTFMLNGMPDAEMFSGTVGALLEDARSRSRSTHSGLTVFGEMVAVLWERGNKEAAVALEELWNDALNQRAFQLHCAYPRAAVTMADDENLICRSHSHVVN